MGAKGLQQEGQQDKEGEGKGEAERPCQEEGKRPEPGNERDFQTDGPNHRNKHGFSHAPHVLHAVIGPGDYAEVWDEEDYLHMIVHCHDRCYVVNMAPRAHIWKGT